MVHRPHWNPTASKDDLATDVSDLLVEFSRDETDRLRQPERIAKTDLMLLERVLGTVKERWRTLTGQAPDPAGQIRAILPLDDGAHYWVALDDGDSFMPVKELGVGPHMARLVCRDGEWAALLSGPGNGVLEIGVDLGMRIVRGSWEANALWGRGSFHQEVRITWLARAMPPKMPREIEPI